MTRRPIGFDRPLFFCHFTILSGSTMSHRVFCESLLSDDVVIDDAEAHHLLHVLRAKPGDQVQLFDGCGTTATATVSRTSRSEVFCTVTSRSQSSEISPVHLTVIASPPKADRLKWMVEKLTEIGVDQLLLLQSERTIVIPGESRVDKLRSTVIGACKQSRRNILMKLLPLQTFTSVLEDIRAGSLPGDLWIAHPSPENAPMEIKSTSSERLVLIGPEGGFTENEVASAVDAGAACIAWPGTILRIETAAVVFASQLLAESIRVKPS